jgi:flagellar assembly factor FliW
MPDYKPDIDPEMTASLNGGDGRLLCLNVAVVPDDIQKMRVNLKAPIVINKSTRKGKQALASNEEYSIRHYIFEEISQKDRTVEQVM